MVRRRNPAKAIDEVRVELGKPRVTMSANRRLVFIDRYNG
jgi:hypothetical protein